MCDNEAAVDTLVRLIDEVHNDGAPAYCDHTFDDIDIWSEIKRWVRRKGNIVRTTWIPSHTEDDDPSDKKRAQREKFLENGGTPSRSSTTSAPTRWPPMRIPSQRNLTPYETLPTHGADWQLSATRCTQTSGSSTYTTSLVRPP